MTRTYDMSKRAAATEETTRRVVDATEDLLATGPIGDVTLQSIADRSGVTVQTVLRHMGSRDGCFRAVAARLQERVHRHRGESSPGDVAGAVRGLLDHYEADGVLVLNLLSQESADTAVAGRAVAQGRDYHRSWVERCFGPVMPDLRQDRVDAIVAATDIYVWKLLRLDMGRSAEATRAVISRTVHALLTD